MKRLFLLVVVILTMVLGACGKNSTKYTDFTNKEKAVLNSTIGEEIPFIESDDYHFVLEGDAIHYYAKASKQQFDSYRMILVSKGYKNVNWNVTDGYTYTKEFITLRLYFDVDTIHIYIVNEFNLETDNGGDNTQNNGGNIGSENQGGNGGDVESNPNQGGTTISNILKEASSLSEGAKLDGDRTVSGIVTEIKEDYNPSFGNVSFVMTDGTGEILVWRAKGDIAETVKVGDTVVVVGVVINYQGTIEFQYPAVSSGKGQPGPVDPTTPPATTNTIGAILKEASSLAEGETLADDRVATGTVVEFKETYTEEYKNVSFVLTDGKDEIIVWRAKGDCAANLKVGDTVTVTGQIINYKGTIEFQYPALSEYTGGSNTPTPDNPNTDEYLYTSFSSSEIGLFNQYLLGEVIPFIPNNEYYLEGLYEEADFENGFCLITYGNTQTEFKNYLNTFSNFGYVLDYQETDDYGDTWYIYVKNNIEVQAVWYLSDGESVVNVFAYIFEDGGTNEPVTPPVGEEGTIRAILAEAAYLTEGQSLGERTVEGTVKEIKESYTTQYKNISFVLTDGTADILVWRAKGDVAETLAVGDTVKVVGEVINFKGTIEFQYPQLIGESSGSNTPSDYLYTTFTNSEINLFKQYLGGEVIPFIPNNEYYLEGYYEETDYENGFYFSAVGVAKSEFTSYLNRLSSHGYEYYSEEADEYGDVWYTYIKNDDIVLDAVWYEYEGEKYVDIAVYSLTLSEDGSDSGSGSENEDVDLITNDGKGLPTSSTGVYDIDFTDATYVKNVAEQGYYLGGCPTTGNVDVLVIPVDFSDRPANSLGYDINKIKTAFNGASGTTDYHSVSEYYFTSSYGKLDLDFHVLDAWFRPANNSSYYLNQTIDYYGYETEIGDQMVINEALAYLESKMDLSSFDSDNNGYIDAVVVVNTLDIDADVTMKWAYRYWNIYEESEGELFEYDGVSANDYLWASYKFLLEEYDAAGNTSYNDNNTNTYTYIHEFGHVLGADDYYDTSYNNEPMLGCDVMDTMLGDHNAYTKFNYGWLTTSRLVVSDSEVTLTLEDFSKNGDTIIIANNWDSALGAYQEYFVLVYYKNTGLNSGDGGYFNNDGIVVYHVNASLYSEEIDGEVYYDVYFNNTDSSDEYGTSENLIELVENANGNIVHTQGMTSNKNTLDDSGNKICYYFTVDSINGDSAIITFVKNK